MNRRDLPERVGFFFTAEARRREVEEREEERLVRVSRYAVREFVTREASLQKKRVHRLRPLA